MAILDEHYVTNNFLQEHHQSVINWFPIHLLPFLILLARLSPIPKREESLEAVGSQRESGQLARPLL